MIRKQSVMLSVGLAVCFGVGFFAYRAKAQSAFLRPVPVSYTYRVVDPKTSAQQALVYNVIRGDGSMVQKTDGLTVIWDVSSKTETVVDQSAHSYVVAPLAKRRLSAFQSKSEICEQYFSAGVPGKPVTCSESSERAFDYPLVKVHIEQPPGSITKFSEDVYAIKELGWIPIRKIQYDFAGTVVSRQEVIELRAGDPAPAEFSIPAGYTAAPTFVEFAQMQKAAKNLPFTSEEGAQFAKKWNAVVAESRAEGDTRFQ